MIVFSLRIEYFIEFLVKEVVKLNFQTTPLFQTNNIDYCCGGNKNYF